jgi:hypothetical protein
MTPIIALTDGEFHRAEWTRACKMTQRRSDLGCQNGKNKMTWDVKLLLYKIRK